MMARPLELKKTMMAGGCASENEQPTTTFPQYQVNQSSSSIQYTSQETED